MFRLWPEGPPSKRVYGKRHRAAQYGPGALHEDGRVEPPLGLRYYVITSGASVATQSQVKVCFDSVTLLVANLVVANCLVDTGAGVSILRSMCEERQALSPHFHLQASDGKSLNQG